MVVLYQFLQPSDQVSSLEGRTEITQPTNNAKKGKNLLPSWLSDYHRAGDLVLPLCMAPNLLHIPLSYITPCTMMRDQPRKSGQWGHQGNGWTSEPTAPTTQLLSLQA